MARPRKLKKLPPFKFSAINELRLPLRQGIRVNFVKAINKYDRGSLNAIINDTYKLNKGQELTLLIEATLHGCLKIIKYMLTIFNVNLNAQGKFKFIDTMVDGITALWSAAGCGRIEIVKFLIENGAYVDCCTKTNSTPLRVACYFGRLDIVKYLVEYGADVNKTDIFGSTCLIIASQRGHGAVVGYLLNNGADVDKQTNCGATALHFAAQAGHLNIVIKLVNSKARNLKNEHSFTAILVAAERGHEDVVSYLDLRYILTRDERIEVNELLGATLFNYPITEHRGLHFLETSMQMRFETKPIIHKKVYKKVEAYGNRVECQTLQDLNGIRGNSEALHYESLIIRERILGDKNPDLLPSIMNRALIYEDTQNYTPCVKLWLHAMKIAQKNQSSILEYVIRFVKVFYEMFLDRIQIKLLELKTVFEVINAELQCVKTKLLTSSADEREAVEREYFQIILSTLKLIRITHFALKQEGNSEDVQKKKELSNAIVELIKLQAKTKKGQTFLHLSLDYETSCHPLFIKGVVCFPDYDTMKLLIDCGADVNAVDFNRNTPLHYIDKFLLEFDFEPPLYGYYFIKEIVMELLKSGAHTDFVNNQGVCPHTGFLSTEFNLSNKTPLSLKCLSARSLASLPKSVYHQRLPKLLEDFIKLH